MACRRKWQQLTAILILASGVRLVLLFLAPGNTDIQLYKNVSDIVGQRGITALYAETPGLYPYPPVWVLVQVLAGRLAQNLGKRLFNLCASADCACRCAYRGNPRRMAGKGPKGNSRLGSISLCRKPGSIDRYLSARAV